MANSLPDFTRISQPFAVSGNRSTIPQTTTGTNAASFQDGFPPITSTPLPDGGMPPKREDFNALGYASTSTLAFLQQGGLFTFDTAISNLIGGYPQGAVLNYIVDNKVYRLISLINNNTYNFNSDASYIGQYWDYVNDNQNTGGNHIGSIFTHPSAKPPPGAFLLNGQTIYNCKEMYPDFWAWLQEEIGEMVDVPLYKPWTQPALTENGTMGGDSYAATASNSPAGFEAWKSLSTNTADGLYAASTANGIFPQYLEFYSPVKLKVQKIVLNASLVLDGNLMKGYVIKASNNGEDWNTLLTGAIQNTSVAYGEQFELPINEEFQAGPEYGWNYIRIEVTSNFGDLSYVDYPKIFITAQQYYRTAKVSNGYIRAVDAQYYEYAVAQYGICGAFIVSENDVRLPLYNNAFLQAGDSSNIGTEVEAGLPNITGQFISGAFTYDYNYQDIKGACKPIGVAASKTYGSTAGENCNILTLFDASLSNDAYGKSDTVQPLSIRVSYCIQVFNAATELSTQDSAQLASQMQMKAQTDFANVTEPVQAFKDMAIAWGMPDYTAGVDITSSLTAANSEYTVPYDCLLVARVGSEQCVYLADRAGITNVTGNHEGYLVCIDGASGIAVSDKLLCQKGMKLYTVTNAVNTGTIYIYPLKGADK